MKRYKDTMGKVIVYFRYNGQIMFTGNVINVISLQDCDMIDVRCPKSGNKLTAWNGIGAMYKWVPAE